MIGPTLAACAAFVAPATLDAVVQVESGGNELAINVNGLKYNPPRQTSRAEAIATAKLWIKRGYSVDLGLMQVNSRNLHGLGLTVEQVFEPCANIHAGALILSENYSRALRQTSGGQDALKVALSYYNTGSPDRGFSNGYVAQYFIATSPVLIRHWAETNGVGKRPGNPNPFIADTEVSIPDSYFQEVADKSSDKAASTGKGA